MNTSLFNTLFLVQYEYENQLDRERALTLIRLTYSFGSIIFLVTLGLWLASLLGVFVFEDNLTLNLIINGLVFALSPLIALLINRGELQTAAIIYILAFQTSVAVQFYRFGLQFEPPVILAVPIVLAVLMLPPVWSYIVAFMSFVAYIVPVTNGFPRAIPTIGIDATANASFVGPVVLLVAIIYLLLAALGNQLARVLQRYVEGVARTQNQIAAVAAISEAAAGTTEIEQLLEVVVRRIREAYGFYHAQVFLLDQAGRQAVLEASTGRAGQALLARRHTLPVGSKSVVGQCTSRAEPVVVNDTLASQTHRPNPLLPDTRAELALPLVVTDRVIGVIDVQSVTPNVFSSEAVRSLQVIAGQLAVAVDKTRLLSEVRQQDETNRQLLVDAQKSINEIETLNRQLTRQGWNEYLQLTRQQEGIGFTIYGDRLVEEDVWSASMKQAYSNSQSVVIRQDRDVQIVSIPLRIRGEVIGVLEAERSGDQIWTEDDIDMLEELVERLSLAVENARLFERSTRAIEREQFVNQLSQRVQGAKSVDDVLQSALTELSDLLGASKGLVKISASETVPPQLEEPTPEDSQ